MRALVSGVVLSLLWATGCESGTQSHLTGDGGVFVPDGSMALDHATIDFGDVVLRTSVVKSVQVTNLSDIYLDLSASVSPAISMQPFSVDGTPFTVAPGGTKELSVTFAPTTVSGGTPSQASLVVSPQNGVGVSAGLQGLAVQAGLQISPNPIDFNFVQPGQQATLPITLTNVANQPIRLTTVSVVAPTEAFTLGGADINGVLLAAGAGSTDLSVTFAPTGVPQRYTGQLQIESDDAVSTQSIALQGVGGGAAISCMPTSLDFTETAVGLTSILPITCTNTGTDLRLPNYQLDSSAELSISGFQVTPGNGVFTAAVDPRWPTIPLSAGQSVQIDVSYSPQAAGNNTASLSILSNVVNPPMIALSGSGIAEAKCNYQVSATSLVWNQVPAGAAPLVQLVTIDDIGPNECLIDDLSVTGDGFSLPDGPIASQRLSAPGTGGSYPSRLTVPIALTPTQAGNYNGWLQFGISDPDAPSVTVTLAGTVGQSCFLLKPAALDFGVVSLAPSVSCSATSKSFFAVNGCGTQVTITGASVATDTADFTVAPSAGSMVVHSGGTSPPFEVTYAPAVAGKGFGQVAVQTDLQETAFGVYPTGSAIAGTTWTDHFVGVATAQADILWVMGTEDSYERSVVAAQTAEIIDSLNADGIDYQIGVTSTDVCGTPGSEDGRILPCDGCHVNGASPTIVTPNDSSAASDLATLMGLGGASQDCDAGGDWLFEAAAEAVVSGSGQTYNVANGFIRPSATLLILTVIGDDQDDNSTDYTPNWYATEFLSVKGSAQPQLFSWSVINPSRYGAPGGQQPFNRLPTRIASMLALVGGVAVDSTQTDWTDAIDGLWRSLALNATYPLSGVPDPVTIQVYLNGPPPDQAGPGVIPGTLVPASNADASVNWTYDVVQNAVIINGQTVSLLSTDTIDIEYTLMCP
jgi:hypothetical protein